MFPLVVLDGDQPTTVEFVQTEETTKFQEELNGASVVLEVEDMIADFVEAGGRVSGEIFEKRFEEIDKALSRFDTMSGETLGVNVEGKNEGITEQRTTRGAEFTPKSVERHVGKLADVKETTQPRVHEENLVSVPIIHSALCDISNVIGPRKNSARLEKLKRVRKKGRVSLVENVGPRGVKNTKRLASEVDCSELPGKKRQIYHSDHELNNLIVEAVVQPRQQQ